MISLSRCAAALSLLSAAAILSGCAGARNIKSVKADDYTLVPRQVLVVIPARTALTHDFNVSLAGSLAKCGTVARFSAEYGLPDAKASHFDAVLTATPLGTETTTTTTRFSSSSYVSMVRFEFSMIDTTSQKNVWKEQIDFTNGDQKSLLNPGDKEQVWASALFDSMVKNKLVGSCDSDRAVPQAAELYYHPAPGATTVQGKATTVTFSAGSSKYATADEALTVLRQIADGNVAKVNSVGLQTYAPLLLIVPSQEEIEKTSVRISGATNEDDVRKYTLGTRELQYESYVRAFRKANLFESVDALRSNEVQSGDFKGHAYKLWFVPAQGKTPGDWVLASAKGGERHFQLANLADLQMMVVRTENQLEDLPR